MPSTWVNPYKVGDLLQYETGAYCKIIGVTTDKSFFVLSTETNEEETPEDLGPVEDCAQGKTVTLATLLAQYARVRPNGVLEFTEQRVARQFNLKPEEFVLVD